jgi:flagellar hook-associated protein 1 FlgK
MPLQTAQGFFLGTGVDVETVNRMRDRFVDVQYRQAGGSFGSASMKYGVLSQIETVLGEPTDSGLQSTMNKFFNSFQELAGHPEEAGPRNAVIQNANALTQTFNRLSQSFSTQRANISEDATNKIAQINSLSQQIATLNTQIVNARGSGNQPSDLMDQRDVAIDQLSQLTNITAAQDSNGSMIVSLGGTQIIGNGNFVTLQSSMTGGALSVTTASGQAISISGGELGGMLEMYNTTIPGYMTQLDTLANSIISRVNAVHTAGYGLGNPPPTGVNFFTGNSAATMGVYSQVQSNPNFIAASSTGQPGDNTNARALFGISEERLMDGNTMTLSQYYGRFVSTLGSAVSSAKGLASGAELVLSQTEAQRDSISGVSIDEEMTNLIKYQRSFEAAARLVNTTNELFQTVLNMV